MERTRHSQGQIIAMRKEYEAGVTSVGIRGSFTCALNGAAMPSPKTPSTKTALVMIYMRRRRLILSSPSTSL
jgi:hypothetical protein